MTQTETELYTTLQETNNLIDEFNSLTNKEAPEMYLFTSIPTRDHVSRMIEDFEWIYDELDITKDRLFVLYHEILSSLKTVRNYAFKYENQKQEID